MASSHAIQIGAHILLFFLVFGMSATVDIGEMRKQVKNRKAILIGVNAVDFSGYPDCRPEFIAAFNRLVEVGTRDGVAGTPIQVLAPLQYGSKSQIIREAMRPGLSFDGR